MNHAWRSTFLNVMFRKMLGVEILVPGWEQWIIDPVPDLEVDITATITTTAGRVYITVASEDHLVTTTGGAALLDFVSPAENRWTYKLITAP